MSENAAGRNTQNLELVKSTIRQVSGTPFENEANEKMKEINRAYDILQKEATQAHLLHIAVIQESTQANFHALKK